MYVYVCVCVCVCVRECSHALVLPPVLVQRPLRKHHNNMQSAKRKAHKLHCAHVVVMLALATYRFDSKVSVDDDEKEGKRLCEREREREGERERERERERECRCRCRCR